MHKGLNSYRALAFFAILLFHLGFLDAGYLGVQAFFVLSGFLLTPILVEMKSTLNKRNFFVHFYGRRALRIFPLYYVFLLGLSLIFILYQVDDSHFYHQLPYLLSYTFNFYLTSDYHNFVLTCSHLWSLAVEEQFYLLWPMVIYFTPDRNLKKILLYVILSGSVCRYLIDCVVTRQWFSFFHERSDVVIYVLPFSHFDAFAIGGFFALYQQIMSSLKVWGIIVAALGVGFISEWLAAPKDKNYDFEFLHFMSDSYQYIWGYSLANYVFAVIILQVREKTFLRAVFENPVLCYLGIISYGLYVFHFPILTLFHSILASQPLYLVNFYILLATILISCLSYELLEKRIIALKDRYFAKTTSDYPKNSK